MPHKDYMYDRYDEIPGKETSVQLYNLPSGGRLARASVNGNYYAIRVDSDRTHYYEYELIDTNGDGKFDIKVELK